MIVKEIRASSILNKSKIYDYCLNPYTGCQFNCRYCYARLFIRRFSGHKEPWGEFVDVKINAPELLKKQVIRARKGKVWVSSVTDPYQFLEKKHELTRQCLKELAKSQFPVVIQTKSELVLRDLDLIQEFEDIEVGFTITTDDERVAKLFEPHASPVKQRLMALEKIQAQGIRTFAFIGPILPGSPEKLVALLEGKTDNVLIDRMNYMGSIKGFYYRNNLLDATTNRFFSEYKNRLKEELRKRGMNFEVLF
ncbi:MAG: radical SAM protein [Candidatus Aminicenantes bacterium]|nr:radical SAM protein [Candidatus Aminicenantes bacterium]